MKIVHVPINDNYTLDLQAYRKVYLIIFTGSCVLFLIQAITTNTILLVASAPEYTHGIVDPVSDISEIAVTNGLPLHVDACFGGFMLPW